MELHKVHAADKDVTDAVVKIAESLKKGDVGKAKKLALALAKQVDDLDDVMDVFKPRKKKGLGVGTTPGAIVPDGIEQMLLALGRVPIGAGILAKDAVAFEDMGYVIAAVAEVAHAKPPAKFNGKQKKENWKAWSQDAGALGAAFAAAANAKNAPEVSRLAGKITAVCNNCHADFR